ncbi:MAG: 4-vinyl reductase [ANME-2 cluster archaeon]|nr:4-vinyl reductase [ANME-2 cluster archaeon]
MSYLVKSAIKILWEKIFHLIDNDLPGTRPNLGDYINTVETQKRLDYILFYNPNMVRVEYLSTLNSTTENVSEYNDNKKLNQSIFRNFSRLEPGKAMKLLQILNRNIYGPLFRQMGQGYGAIRSLDHSARRIKYEVRGCNECMDLPNVGFNSCFYFSGMLAGIFSALFHQPMGAYESSCVTHGDQLCNYEIGYVKDIEFSDKVEDFLTVNVPPGSLQEIESTLQRKILESLSNGSQIETKIGSYVHIFIYQLRMLNTLSQNPEIYSETYQKAGVRFSYHLVNTLRQFYNVDGEKLLTEAMPKYYRKQLLANIHSVEKFEDGYLVTFSEPMDCSGIKELDIRPCSFMKGEIEGIANIAIGKKITCEINSCRFDSGEPLCQYRLFYEMKEAEIPQWLKEMQEQ